MKNIALSMVFCFISLCGYAWGFFGHQRINRMAIFTLPPEMFTFYKYHIRYITENAVNPDKRRYAVEGEAERHYIDIDVYGDSAIFKMPRRWEDAVAKYTEDTLRAYGIAPWHLQLMKFQLVNAFMEKNVMRILRISADMGHYIGDSNVPLHTTQNYNGQMTGQYGIHGFWESRLPEIFADDYDYFLEKAQYIKSPSARAWQAVTNAHLALDSVLKFEKILSAQFSEDKKYSFETRGNITVKVYSREFSSAYHQMLAGQVERQMRASIQMVGDFWYTCWIDAGQPNLDSLVQLFDNQQDVIEEKDLAPNPTIKTRTHEIGMSFPQQKPTYYFGRHIFRKEELMADF
ncbi:MAG: zinc dependent phospholipase C family protein [Thermoflexibacter sp.]|jgi:hypothetical protein|nr:zinc dependent phospholipase C family protein [Thermoflexibacter sp.]